MTQLYQQFGNYLQDSDLKNIADEICKTPFLKNILLF